MFRFRLGHVNAYPADADQLAFRKTFSKADEEVARVLCLGGRKRHESTVDKSPAQVLRSDLQHPALPLDRSGGAFVATSICWLHNPCGTPPAAFVLRRRLAPEIDEVA